MTKRERDVMYWRKRAWAARTRFNICPTDGFPITYDTVDGKLTGYCQGCDRRIRRLCMDCGVPVTPRNRSSWPWRCPTHIRAARLKASRIDHRRRDPKEHCEREKARYRNDPLYNLKRRMYLKEWRAKYPEKVEAQRLRVKRRKAANRLLERSRGTQGGTG